MEQSHVCKVCGGTFSYHYPPNQKYCMKCGDAIDRADHPTYVLIAALIERIEKLEGR